MSTARGQKLDGLVSETAIIKLLIFFSLKPPCTPETDVCSEDHQRRYAEHVQTERGVGERRGINTSRHVNFTNVAIMFHNDGPWQKLKWS